MKISMIPNKIVKLIHASKGDTSLRKWTFEPYDNNGAISVSNIKLQLVYKTENGGTEQLLPVNTSTPTTSYFDGTINYGTDTDVEFTYKQSSYTGQARIKSIKGNTVVWNQLRSPIVGSSSPSRITGTFTADGKCVFTGTSTGANVFVLGRNIPMHVDHKYLILFNKTLDANRNIQLRYSADGTTDSGGYLANIYNSTIFTYTNSTYPYVLLRFYFGNGVTLNDTFYISMYDLTMIFGSGKEPSSVSEFKQYYPLDYYAYGQYLLNFNGEGIKTTGKNLCPKFSSGTGANLTYTANEDGSVHVTGTNTGTAFFAVQFTLPAGTYILSGAPSGGQLTIRNASGGGAPSSEFSGQLDDYGSGCQFTVSATASAWLNIRSVAGAHDQMYYPMIRKADTDSTYEPYTSSTLSLPISTYFPTGMKSAGDVYDELSDKAITRVGSVDLGSLTWTYTNDTGHLRFVSSAVTGIKIPATNMIANAVCPKYNMVTEGNVYNNQKVGLCVISNNRLMLYDPSFTDASTLTTALSNVYLNFELATYTETDIQNASLVCKDIETPCYLSSGNLVCDATEELTNESGFFDAKLKIKDSSSVAYSSKFKLHVEDL